MSSGKAETSGLVERHKTAIARSTVSAPVFLLQSGGVITEQTTVLDYGCGQGHDIEALGYAGIDAKGWDPHFAPDRSQLVECDVVNLGFVLNVIEESEERAEALRNAFGYARQCLAVSVMLIGKGDLSNSRPYKDGFITSRKTFQKYYTQAEMREFIIQTINAEPVPAGPGIFFVFKDEIAEQRFLFRRQIGFRSKVASSSQTAVPSAPTRGGRASGADKAIVRDLSEVIRNLGRYPEESELPSALQTRVSRSKHALPYLANLAIQEVDAEELEHSATQRTDDLRLFFALNAFGQRQAYRQMPPELQRDVRAFFGSHQRAVAEGQALLFSIGNSEKLLEDAQAALSQGIGRLADGKFQFHIRDLPKLSPTLRGYVSIGERLAGDLSDATLLRIHLLSKKLSALYCPDFDTSPLPRLTRRVKVEFQTFDVALVDHTQDGKVKLLYLRSKYLQPEHPHYQAQRHFDDQLEAYEGLDFSGEGPDLRTFSGALKERGLVIPQFSK